MGGEHDAADVLQAAIDRQPLFGVLRDGGATRADVQGALNVSRSTAHRIVNRFESLGLVEQANGVYRLTPFGRVVADETEYVTSTVAVASRLSPLLETFERATEDVELHVFEDADVTVPEPGDPYRPMRRLLVLVEDAARIREFAPTMPDPAYLRTLYHRVQSQLDATVLYPGPVVDRLRRENEVALERALADGDLDVRVGDVPEFQLVVADDHVYVGGYNDDASRLCLVAETDDPAAVEWANECFRNRWTGATPYEDYRDAEDD